MSSRPRACTPALELLQKLRHSFVSIPLGCWSAARGHRPTLGHRSTTVTEAVYRKQLRPAMAEGAEAMDRIFLAAEEPRTPRSGLKKEFLAKQLIKQCPGGLIRARNRRPAGKVAPGSVFAFDVATRGSRGGRLHPPPTRHGLAQQGNKAFPPV
jgi:hypothetical protein